LDAKKKIRGKKNKKIKGRMAGRSSWIYGLWHKVGSDQAMYTYRAYANICATYEFGIFTKELGKREISVKLTGKHYRGRSDIPAILEILYIIVLIH